MQIMESLDSPELKGRDISPHLHYFIEKMVAKDADHRYQSWSELVEDVRAHLAGREDLNFEDQIRQEAAPRAARWPRGIPSRNACKTAGKSLVGASGFEPLTSTVSR